MEVKTFFHKPTFTLTYLVYDPTSKDAILIDPALDYDPHGSIASESFIQNIIQFIRDNGLNLHYSFETHAHADHLTAAPVVKREFPDIKIAISENIKEVQESFKSVFNFSNEFDVSGSAFCKLLKDGEVINAGTLNVEVIDTPGHTPACVSLLVNNQAVFTGDALFMPDFGVGRCDFPKGDAGILYESVFNKLYNLPEETRVYVGHDYQPGGRELAFESTIGEEKSSNIHINGETSKEDFIKFRQARDKTLAAPVLLLPSIQVNAQAGYLPPAEPNGVSYLKIPVVVKD